MKVRTKKRKRKSIRSIGTHRIDPTRTITLRRSLERELAKRFARLRLDIYELIATEDALGLRQGSGSMADIFKEPKMERFVPVDNVFCATGKGGGVDPTCSPGGSRAYARKVNLDGITDDAVKARIDKVLGDLSHEYGITLTTVSIAEMEKDIFDNASAARMSRFVSYTGSFKHGDAKIDSASYHLDLDRNVWKDQQSLREYRKSLPDGYLADGSSTGMLRHEFAHALETSHPESAAAIAKIYASYKATPTISTYSASSSKEMVAEAFSYYKLQGSLNGTGLEGLQPVFDSWRSNVANAREGISSHRRPPRSGIAIESRSDSTTIAALRGKGWETIHSGEMGSPVNSREAPRPGRKIRREGQQAFVNNARWFFLSLPEKIKAFLSWLKEKVDRTLRGRSEEELLTRYAEMGLRKGAARSFDDANRSEAVKAHLAERLDFYQGSREQFLRDSFRQPIAIDKIRLLAARSFTDLKNVTEDMSTKMSRILTDGLVQGKGPREVARDLMRQVDLSKKRALDIAQTEIIRAHADGQLMALRATGVEEVGVAAEWSVTKNGKVPDSKVCPLCLPLDGVVFTLDEAEGRIPKHVRCRCAWVPAFTGVSKKIMSKVGNVFCPTGKGGGIDPTCSSGGKDVGTETTPLSHMDVLNEVADLRNRWGYNYPMSVKEEEGRLFERGGVQWREGGNCHLDSGLVTIFSKSAGKDVEGVRRLTAHELMHGTFEVVYKRYTQEQEEIANHSIDAIKATGELRPGFEKQFPTYARFWKFREGTPLEKFVEDDGITDYSRAYWKDYKDRKVSFHIAVHETLAEIAAHHEATGVILGSPLYRDYYKKVRDEFRVLSGQQKTRKERGHMTINESLFSDHTIYLDKDLRPTTPEKAIYIKWWTKDGKTGWGVKSQDNSEWQRVEGQ